MLSAIDHNERPDRSFRAKLEPPRNRYSPFRHVSAPQPCYSYWRRGKWPTPSSTLAAGSNSNRLVSSNFGGAAECKTSRWAKKTPTEPVRGRAIKSARGRCSTWRCRWSRSWRTSSLEIELPDARVPVKTAGVSVVFAYVPEGHAIGGIDDGHAIIAPTANGVGLTPRATEQRSFSLAKVTWRIGFEASCIADSRERSRT